MNSLTHPSYTKDKRTFSILDEGNSGIGGKIGEILAPRRDKFLEERPLQPKKAVQEYVASHGILIPQQFSSLEEAFASGKKFIIRSEHPQEYDGVSGLSESFVVDPEEIQKYRASKTSEQLRKPAVESEEIQKGKMNSENEFYSEKRNWNDIDVTHKHKLIQATIARYGYLSQEDIFRTLKEFFRTTIDGYSKKLGIDTEQVMQEQSYSFWEYIDGVNHTIVADIHIPGRYYIISNSYRKGRNISQTYMDMIIIQDGQIISQGGHNFFKSLDDNDKSRVSGNNRIYNHTDLLGIYEKVKMLPNFDPEHCPIMEFQTSRSGNPYFLQYHRGRDKVETINFSIERELEEGEFESPFFRGITPPEGYEVEAAYYYKSDGKSKGWSFPLCDEDASFDSHWDTTFIQIMSRKRKVNFETFYSLNGEVGKLCTGHLSIASVFKPEMYVTIPKKYKGYYNTSQINALTGTLGVPYRVKIRVISDGKKCYVKFITTPEEVEEDFQKYCDGDLFAHINKAMNQVR